MIFLQSYSIIINMVEQNSENSAEQFITKPDEAICAFYIGEHTEDVAPSICKWLTECLQRGITPEQFVSNWEHFEENEWEPTEMVPGITEAGAAWVSHDFLTNLHESQEKYRIAYERGADRFIPLNDNAFIDIVAIKGSPNPTR